MNKLKLEKSMNRNLEILISLIKQNNFKEDHIKEYSVSKYFLEYRQEVGPKYVSKYFKKGMDRIGNVCKQYKLNKENFIVGFYFGF